MPRGHDKVPPMIGDAMPLLNPRLNTGCISFCGHSHIASVTLLHQCSLFLVSLIFLFLFAMCLCLSMDNGCHVKTHLAYSVLVWLLSLLFTARLALIAILKLDEGFFCVYF